VAQRARLEQTRRNWQASERLLQWVVRACYVGLAVFGLYWVGYALALGDASYLAGTVLCAISAVLTWKLFGTSTRVQHPPIPTQVLAVSGYVEPFTKSYGSSYQGGTRTVLHFVRVGDHTFPVLEGTGEAFDRGMQYRLYYVDYLAGFLAKSLALNLLRRGNGTLLSAEPLAP